jgi:O-acetyl-ADP-ribose deacetylase (regulator of RNase III)
MQVMVNQARLELVQGDITHESTDAIVNAANSSLLGGGGVDGAIHRAGGPRILEESRRLGPCPTGEARITGGGKLPARYVIHAVGPIYDERSPEEAARLLASAYRSSLELATQHQVRTLAFPSISTGVYSYPVAAAAVIALETVMAYLRRHPEIDLVRFVLFDPDTFAAYRQALERLSGGATAQPE